jgi:hypothetical protein
MTSSLVDVRAKLAAVLAPVTDEDPDVHAAIVDAVSPPALIVGWGVPMLDTFAACTAFANLAVAIIGERLETASGLETIETNYQRIVSLTRADGGWSVQGDSGVGTIEIAKTLYLACRVDIRVPIGL